jgi:ketol-acid reductoisomerase
MVLYVEEGMQIRKDITVIMCAPKCPGSEVREEYKEVLEYTLIAVHPRMIQTVLNKQKLMP